MFDALDSTLASLFADGAVQIALPELYNAEKRFDAPDRLFVPQQDTAVNLFLYHVHENRELRDPEPWTETRNGVSVRCRPPLRVDCSYLVTTWAKKPPKITTEHLLLAQTLSWAARFATIPERHLQGILAAPAVPPGQPFPLPTMVAQAEAGKNIGEFWQALSIAPRAYFTLVVTIAMHLDRVFEDPIVTTLSSRYRPIPGIAPDERIIIGGVVRDSTGEPVADAWVRLEPGGVTQVTNANGQFLFSDVRRGAGFTLRARAPGLGETHPRSVEIPSITRDYDLQFS